MHSAKLKLAATCLMWKIPNRRFWMWSFDLSWSATVSVGSMNESLECTIGLAAEILKIRRMLKMHNLFWVWIYKALAICDICVTPTSKPCTCASDQAVLHVLVPAVLWDPPPGNPLGKHIRTWPWGIPCAWNPRNYPVFVCLFVLRESCDGI